MKHKINLIEIIFFIYLFCLLMVPQFKRNIEIMNTHIPLYFFISLVTIIFGLILYIHQDKTTLRFNNINKKIFIYFILILFYAFITILIQGDAEGIPYKFMPLILSFCSIFIPYLYILFLSKEKLKQQKFLSKIGYLITSCTLVYLLISGGINLGDAERLSTPLGGAAVNHVALLLVLSIFMANIKMKYQYKTSVLMFLITLILIFLTGSRAGIITLVLFVILVLIIDKAVFRNLLYLLLFTLLFITVINIFPNERLKNFESSSRSENYNTSYNIIKESKTTLFFGKGTGEIWPWYGYENNSLKFDFVNLELTEYGYVLSNPHSVFWGILVELGLIGLLLFILIIINIIKELIKSIKSKNIYKKIILLGIISTLPAFLLDYYLFKNFVIAFIWWTILFTVLKITDDIEFNKN